MTTSDYNYNWAAVQRLKEHLNRLIEQTTEENRRRHKALPR